MDSPGLSRCSQSLSYIQTYKLQYDHRRPIDAIDEQEFKPTKPHSFQSPMDSYNGVTADNAQSENQRLLNHFVGEAFSHLAQEAPNDYQGDPNGDPASEEDGEDGAEEIPPFETYMKSRAGVMGPLAIQRAIEENQAITARLQLERARREREEAEELRAWEGEAPPSRGA